MMSNFSGTVGDDGINDSRVWMVDVDGRKNWLSGRLPWID